MNNYKMSIKAKVNCPKSVLYNPTEIYHGKDVEIIDFVPTEQGLTAICLIEEADGFHFIPLFMGELIIEKEKAAAIDRLPESK